MQMREDELATRDLDVHGRMAKFAFRSACWFGITILAVLVGAEGSKAQSTVAGCLTAGVPGRDGAQDRQTCPPFAGLGECSVGDWCQPTPGTCTAGLPDGLCVAVAGAGLEGDSCDGLTWETGCGENLECLVGECRALCLQQASMGEPGDTCQAMDSCAALRGDECIGFCASPELVFVDDFEIGYTCDVWSQTTTLDLCNGADDDCDGAWDEDDSCDDDDACTLDSCQGLSGCEHIPDPAITCLPNAACEPGTGDCLCGGTLCEDTGTNCCLQNGSNYVCDPDPCNPDPCTPVMMFCARDCNNAAGFLCEDLCEGVVCYDPSNPDCDPRTGECLCGQPPSGVLCSGNEFCCPQGCMPQECEPPCTTPPYTACDPCTGCYDPGD